jgi:competence ComEA-like helix-hairpin-helix protein
MAGKGIDINQASVEELRDACGIEESVAEAIVEARSEGEFDSIEEVGSLPGVGQRSVDMMKQSGCHAGGR